MKHRFNISYIKKIAEPIIFLCILCYLFIHISYLFANTGYNRNHITGLKEEPPLDMVYIGGSAAFRYWETLKAWNDKGIASYLYATDTIQAESIKHYIEECLKIQNPDVFVVDARPFQYWDSSADEGEVGIRNGLDSMDYSLNKFCFAKDYLTNRELSETTDTLSYYLQIVKYHTNYQSVLSNSENWNLNKNRQSSKYKGWEYYGIDPHCPLVVPEPFDTNICAELQTGCFNALNNLIGYCKNKNLKVLFVVCPYSITEEDQQKYNSIEKIVKDAGFDFLNTNLYYDEMGIDFETDFYDINHVNCFGAEKYTEFLENYLDKNYNLPDHREDVNYESWNVLYNEFITEDETKKTHIQSMIDSKNEAVKIGNKMKEVVNPEEWLLYAQNSNFTLIIATNGKWKTDKADYRLLLQNLGITQWNLNNYIKVESGTDGILAEDSGDDYVEYELNIGKAGIKHEDGGGTSHVKISSGENAGLILKNFVYPFKKDGVYIAVYNNNLNQLIDIVVLNNDGENTIISRE